MYLPYLRAKQFELIALRELCETDKTILQKVSPIIEPVKDSSTLRSTLSALAEKNINFNIILNPRVGGLINERDKIVEIIRESFTDYQNFQFTYIIDRKTEPHIDQLLERAKSIESINNQFSLIHNSSINPNGVSELLRSLNVVYNIIHFSKTSRRYYRQFEEGTTVSLDDYFLDQQRNADYLAQDESEFSEEYRYYARDGFVGFSDFLTIGDSYIDTGFLPRAVAIHLSYIDNQTKFIKIKHFVSDSNEDLSDIGGKFAEALHKLVEWCDANKYDSLAVRIFKDLQHRGHFPGLGTIKKLSIMNHIELVNNNI